MKYVLVLYNRKIDVDLKYYFDNGFQEYSVGKRMQSGSEIVLPRVIGCWLDIPDLLFEHVSNNFCFTWTTANTGGCEDYP